MQIELQAVLYSKLHLLDFYVIQSSEFYKIDFRTIILGSSVLGIKCYISVNLFEIRTFLQRPCYLNPQMKEEEKV